MKTPIVLDGDIYIKIVKDGPYLVYGNPVIKQEFIEPDKNGASWYYREGKDFSSSSNTEVIALCRCGKSKNAPFCDGLHIKTKFIGTETASRNSILQEAEEYVGDKYTILDNEVYCAFARFCDAFNRVWNLVREGTEEASELALREVFHCPAGRLMIKKTGSDELIEPILNKEIGVLEDPKEGCSGPLYVKGRIKIESSDGRVYEIRNRVTLCRCGMSSNKPFCDGEHAAIKFQDGKNKTFN